MREMSFMEEAFVAEWATFVGQALDWEGFQHWPRSLVDVVIHLANRSVVYPAGFIEDV